MIKFFEQFSEDEVKIGDMIFVDPDVCRHYRRITKNTQYEVIEIDKQNSVYIFNDVNDYIYILKKHVIKVDTRAPDDEVRWFEDGKLEQKKKK